MLSTIPEQHEITTKLQLYLLPQTSQHRIYNNWKWTGSGKMRKCASTSFSQRPWMDAESRTPYGTARAWKFADADGSAWIPQITADHRRLPQITTDHRRWPPQINADHYRSPDSLLL